MTNISLDNYTIELKKNKNSEVRHYETSISIEDKEKFMENFEDINQYVAGTGILRIRNITNLSKMPVP